MLAHRSGSRITAALTVLVLGAAAAAPSTAFAKHRHRHHHSSGIPQHNGGDHDSDNRGAPSDGDGNV